MKRKPAKRRRFVGPLGCVGYKVAYRDRKTAERFARGGKVYLRACGRYHVTTKGRKRW